MTVVRLSTDQWPEVEQWLKRRESIGKATYDEWRDGEYCTVTAPTPERGELLVKLAVLLAPLAESVGAHLSAPLNIGTEREDCRVAQMGLHRPGMPRTSPAFLEVASLIVHVAGVGDAIRDTLDFYWEHDVEEYLELNLAAGTAILLVAGPEGARWSPITESTVLGFEVTDHEVITHAGRVDVRDFRS